MTETQEVTQAAQTVPAVLNENAKEKRPCVFIQGTSGADDWMGDPATQPAIQSAMQIQSEINRHLNHQVEVMEASMDIQYRDQIQDPQADDRVPHIDGGTMYVCCVKRHISGRAIKVQIQRRPFGDAMAARVWMEIGNFRRAAGRDTGAVATS